MHVSSTLGVDTSGMSPAWSSASNSFIGARGTTRTVSPAATSRSIRLTTPGRSRASRPWMKRLLICPPVMLTTELTRPPSPGTA